MPLMSIGLLPFSILIFFFFSHYISKGEECHEWHYF